MESKIVKAARASKEKGFKFIAAIVKSHYATSYYNVQSVDAIIRAGKWIPAGRHFHGYRIGTASLPEKTILRPDAFRLVK